jgi:hypothetical protein
MKFVRTLSFAIACAACVITAGSQEFQPVPPAGLTPDHIAPGATTFWEYVPAPSFSLYQYNSSSQSMQARGYFSPFKSMSIGGGSAVQNDELWMLDGYNELWRYDFPTQAAQLKFQDNRMQQVVVGPGYTDSCHPYEVWVTLHDTTQNGWFQDRYNFCTKVFESPETAVVSTNPSSISTGGGEVWGINTSNQVFRFNPATNAFVQLPGTLTQIAVGVNGVWGLNASGAVFEFNPVTQVFDRLTGTLTKIAAAGNGVWGINSTNQVVRYEASTRTFFAIASVGVTNLAVGTGGGVWAIDANGNLQAFVTP